MIFNMIKQLTKLLVFSALPLFGEESDKSFTPLFNGEDLKGWINVNCADSTWKWKNDMLHCTGKPTGELRTERMYQNFILELEWRHLKPKGNAGVFVWADDITAPGQPFIRGIEIQVLENAYGNTKSHTTHGDIFPIHGAFMIPLGRSRGLRAFPAENRSKPSPEWNHYRIECRDGNISLAVNGKIVTRGENCTPRKGYICLESEGGVVNYRNVRIQELPDTPITSAQTAIADRGFKSLYTGVDLSGWKASGGWISKDWILAYEGNQRSIIESEAKYQNFGFVVDFLFPQNAKPAEINLRGSAIVLDPKDFKPGKWNRIEGTISGTSLSHSRGGIDWTGPTPTSGPIQLISNSPMEWANVYTRELDED